MSSELQPGQTTGTNRLRKQLSAVCAMLEAAYVAHEHKQAEIQKNLASVLIGLDLCTWNRPSLAEGRKFFLDAAWYYYDQSASLRETYEELDKSARRWVEVCHAGVPERHWYRFREGGGGAGLGTGDGPI